MRFDLVSRSGLAFLLVVFLLNTALDSAHAQRRRTSRSRPAARTSEKAKTAAIAPSVCYKPGTAERDVRLDFVNSGFQWSQPDGTGTAVTITYSYSNLLDGQLNGISAADARAAVEEALALWATYAPLNFVEVQDSGPLPDGSESSYDADSHPQLRIGYHEIDGAQGGALAHAYLPFSDTDGIAGDLHVDGDEDWSLSNGGFFLEMVLHEIGHTLGLDHEETEDAIMNAVIKSRFNALGAGELLADDIAGIRDIYGEGVGSVTPLEDPETPDTPDEPDTPDMPDEPDTPQEPDTPEEPDNTEGVLAVLDGETLMITGDSTDDSVLVMPFFWGVVVSGLDGTQVNGGSWDYFGCSRNADINADLGDGADLLWLMRLHSGVVECNLGSGDDALVVLFSSIESLTADGGSDEDLFFRLGARIGTLVTEGLESEYGF